MAAWMYMAALQITFRTVWLVRLVALAGDDRQKSALLGWVKKVFHNGSTIGSKQA